LREISPGIPIHALFNLDNSVVAAMETEDSQIDFSIIVPSSFAVKTFSYSFRQIREVVPRNIGIDKIV
jgi:hypothetical protein